jgi:hypothetical protein
MAQARPTSHPQKSLINYWEEISDTSIKANIKMITKGTFISTINILNRMIRFNYAFCDILKSEKDADLTNMIEKDVSGKLVKLFQDHEKTLSRCLHQLFPACYKIMSKNCQKNSRCLKFFERIEKDGERLFDELCPMPTATNYATVATDLLKIIGKVSLLKKNSLEGYRGA